MPGGDSSTLSPVHRPATATLAIFAALAAATLLPRVFGLDAGLPLILNEDEAFCLGFARALEVDGDLGGARWHYPPLLGELMTIRSWFGACDQRCDTPQLIRFGREISVFAAVLAVLATAAAARLAGVRRGVAAAAALVLAGSPTFTFMSRQATPDVLCVAFVALALLTCAGLQKQPRPRWYVLAGAAIGLAAGAKYNAGIVCVAVAAAHFTTPQPWRRLPWLLLAAVVSLVAFAATLVWTWDGIEPILRGLRYEWAHYAGGHSGFTTTRPLADTFTHLAVFAFGFAGLAAAAIGTARVTQRADRARLLVVPPLVFAAVYLALIARGQMFVDRVLLPALPALALLAALGLDRLVDAVARRGARTAALATLALAALVLVQPLRITVGQVRALLPEDSRLAAHNWILANLDYPDDHVVAVPRSVRFILKGLTRSDVDVLTTEDATPARLRRATHVIFSRGTYQRFHRTPDRFPAESAEARAIEAELQRIGNRVQSFENPPLPGAELFGTTFPLYHQVAIDIYEIPRP